MDEQQARPAPGFGSVWKHVVSLVRRARWLIAGATIVTAAVAFALTPTSKDVKAWSGRATLRIGLVPAAEYILYGSGTPLTVTQTAREAVAMISNPEFRDHVASQASFQPATAEISRSMVGASLRATIIEDRDVAIELSAGSSADIQAAFQSVSAAVNEIDGKLLKDRLALLDGGIDQTKSRIAAIKESNQKLIDRVLNPNPDDKATTHNAIVLLSPGEALSMVGALQDRIERAEDVKKLSDPTTVRVETNQFLTGSRSVRTLRFSLLAGLAMLVAMVVLTIVLSPPVRASSPN
jgi:hypothetical protein